MSTRPDEPSAPGEPDRLERVERLFHDARALPDGPARAEFLERACGSEIGLRRDVDSLLRADGRADRATRFLAGDRAAERGADADLAEDPTIRPGATIGRYRLLEHIGEGGFGSVWMAEQREPIVRRVALKIIKRGMDTRRVIARFEAERQALAMMEHPCIATVLDAGETERGRPYFVMELVAGEPITRFCDRARLTIQERLRLFRQVCAAVQHAHTKGIVHRDLKPSNVLVTLADGVPLPKIIDFGIAKATSTRLTERTLFTQFGQFLGTPAYMSPEQAAGSPDIDSRSDIYSLGVLLYELVAGVPPFDEERLREAPLDEVIRIVREADPPRPSTRLATSASSAGIAASRRTDPRRLGVLLRGELDWIALRAIEKDRRNRYETAAALAEDILAHVEHRPVRARPPTMGYLLAKFCRRHAGAVAAAAGLGAVVLLGGAGTTIGLLNARAANQRLVAANLELDRSLVEEEHQRRRAEDEARRAEAAESIATRRAEEREEVATFQQRQLTTIDVRRMGDGLHASIVEQTRATLRRTGAGDESIDKEVEALKSMLERVSFATVALRALDETIFQQTIKAIDGQFESQPLVRARLLDTTGQTMHQLGLNSGSLEPLARALDLRTEHLGPDHPETVETRLQLAHLHNSLGRFVEAEAGYRSVIAAGTITDVSLSIEVIRALGGALMDQGRLAEAEPVLLDAFELARRKLDPDRPTAITTVNWLGRLRSQQGRFEEALAFDRETFERRRRVLGADHAYTLQAMLNLGLILHRLGHFEESERTVREAADRSIRALGVDHPATLQSLNHMAGLLYSRGRVGEAIPYAEDAVATAERVHGPGHVDTLHFVSMLGRLRAQAEDLAGAEPLLRRAAEGFEAALGGAHRATSGAAHDLATVLLAQGRPAEAIAPFREAFTARRASFAADDPRVISVHESALGLAESIVTAIERLLDRDDGAPARREASGDPSADRSPVGPMTDRLAEADAAVAATSAWLRGTPPAGVSPARLEAIAADAEEIAGRLRAVRARLAPEP
ncbi:MAG TPA: serine/threonine-protein kinase [Phycisphaerales bacterium]|nr:serine/threonine-protein kinase [Phycisphaerales bacterium]HMP36930.1 serine/threonine-protein kinase [Phycisphaerales bacterium]